jgi:D-beta-D-heptose 7-phosphate kinase/D-beta-D-heptose 1-phosphate adenosyltransferase
VLVVGDVMVDEYLHCQATRISPEAPVMVVRHARTERLPGGAANVARNLMSLGSTATVLGVVGDDRGGELLEEAMSAQNVACELIRIPDRATTRKVRVLADATHQALRIDFETEVPIDVEAERKIIDTAKSLLGECDLLLCSDYVKGTLTRQVVSELVAHCKDLGKFVVANAKPKSIETYRGADLVSVNRLEATEALELGHSLPVEQAPAACQELAKRHGVSAVLVTLGEHGMAAGDATQSFRVPARKVEVFDTAGAGDTVIATVALGMASAGFQPAIFELAAETSACVVRHVGVATPTPSDLAALRQL